VTSSTLLDRVQDKPDVETNLRQLKKRRINERGSIIYIPPQAKASLHASDESRFPLMDRVNKYLKSDQTVLLLLGDSGSGKSTFNRSLEFDLWQAYNAKTGVIPLYINLPAIDKPEHDLVAKQLRKLDFTEPQIRELKYRQFILICDGYDESQQTRNLYTSNRLNEEGEWIAKMVISCRSEYVGHDYRDRFEPGDRNARSGQKLFDEAVITPFSDNQIQEYIRQYVKLHRPLWETESYTQALDLIPGLMDLVKNPFLLTMSLEVLPRMMDPGQQVSAARVTKVALYDQFVEQWLERGKKRIGEKNMSFQARSAFDSLCDEGFTTNGIDYLKKLSVAIYKEQGGQPVVEYSRLNDEGTWKVAFFSQNEEKRLLREACPLVRNGSQYRFIHRSLLEYGFARAVFDPQLARENEKAESTLSRRGSMSSIWSFEIEGGLTEAATVTEEHLVDPNSPLVWRSIVNEASVLQFLSDRAGQEQLFKRRLLAYIEHSKEDKKWRTAAANSITILVKAGVQFIRSDLEGIQIPGADLSYGVFDSAWLQDADLRKANLRGVWMRQTDLCRARMTGVDFGELPSLISEIIVTSCAYSLDGKSLAVGQSDAIITVHTLPSWEHVWTLSGHGDVVVCVVYSPVDGLVASASKDKTVRLWDTETGTCQHIFIGHSNKVEFVAFSPQGDVLASASLDRTIRLWDIGAATCRRIFTSHSSGVHGVAFSPKGGQIVSSSADRTVRIWDVETGVCSRILSGHHLYVMSVAFSPQGDLIASAGSDKTIRLWGVETGSCRHILTGHTGQISGVMFSAKGDQLVSGANDGTIRLWDAATGFCRHTLASNNEAVRFIAYSPKDDQVATVSDYKVRLWDISGISSFVLQGHIGGTVQNVAFSPKGDRFATCSGSEKIVRLWDTESRVCYRNLIGHDKAVTFIAYSPKGDQIASVSNDNTARLWNLETGTSRCISTGQSVMLRGVAYSPQGDVLATASFDGTVRLWDVDTTDHRGTLNGHKSAVSSVVFSPDGKQIATGSGDGTARLWDLGAQTCSHILKGHTGWVPRVVYSPQGDQLASASSDRTVRLWDVKSGDCQLTLDRHYESVLCITYSAKGDILASGSLDKTIRLWNVASGECLAVTPNFHIGIHSISWRTTSDGDFLFTGCGDGSVIEWEVMGEEDEYYIRLSWCNTKGALTVMGADIQGVRGLSKLNEQLLKQREADGEPEHV